jgi:hypothetical protein
MYVVALPRLRSGVIFIRFSLPPLYFYRFNQALDRGDLTPRIRRKSLSALCKICGRYALLPKSSRVSISFDSTELPFYHGGFANVWKGEHQGRPVAVKGLRIYSNSNFEKQRNVNSENLSRDSLSEANSYRCRCSARRL